jgi:hypothetical protein
MEKVKKYLIFIFGPWKVLEQESDIFNHIKDVLEAIIVEKQITFITGEHMLIANVKSNAHIEEVHKIMEEFLRKDIPAYFIFPDSEKVKYRINPMLEASLFGETPDKLNIDLMKNFEDALKKNLKLSMEEIKKMKEMGITDTPMTPNIGQLTSSTLPLNIDSILEKIYAHGLHSLNNNEKEFLKQQKK